MTTRLQEIAQMIPSCMCFYDIGTDHGHLPAYLLQQDRAKRVMACDISKSSLDKAARLFDRLGFVDRAGCHLGDGLQGLTVQAEDCVAICGVGARTMLGILPHALPCPVVLSTHIEPERLRATLPTMGYRIVQEKLVLEDRRFYLVMLLHTGQDLPYSEAEIDCGRLLVDDPLFLQYLAWRESVAIKASYGGDVLWKNRLAYIQQAKAW